MSVQGIVVSYKSERGFGFIKSASVERDLFFHISQFRHEDIPEPGMKVTFDLKVGADGRNSACNIRFIEASKETYSNSKLPRRDRYREKKQLPKQVHTASVSITEGSDSAEYSGTLRLDDRVLQFDGSSWFTGKVITRSRRFITSVKTPLFGPYEIYGGGPKLFVKSTNFFFTGEDLKALIRVLSSQS
jgi:cold shock CspA family protein